MRAPHSRARRWLAPVIVAAVCVGGVAGSFGQSSASPAASGAAIDTSGAARHAATAEAAAGSKRHGKRLPDPKSLVSGVVGLSTAARDGRAKVDVQVPTVDAAAYLDPAYRTPASQLVNAPAYYLPRHPLARCTYKEAVVYSDLYAVHIKQPNPKKDGVVESVGHFPAAHVSALGFGAIPVTATLHTHQVKRNGQLLPITANTATSFTSLPLRASGAPCDPSWDTGGSQTPPLGTISHGQLAVRISNIQVDKQTVDVGDDCHTVTPLHLNLFGSPGYILYTGGQLIGRADPTKVHSGQSVYPLHPGSSNMTIPGFTGCMNPKTGEDLSRLVTAMVSGHNNTVAVHQSTAVLNGISNAHPTLCLSGQGCVKHPSFVSPPKPGMTARRGHQH